MLGRQARQEDRQDAEQRHVGTDLEDEVDAVTVGDAAEQGCTQAAGAEGEPKMPAIMPTRPGTSSCAKTTMLEEAEENQADHHRRHARRTGWHRAASARRG